MICRTCLRRASALNFRQAAPVSSASFSSSAIRPFIVSASSRQASAGTVASPASATAQPSTTPKLSTPVDGPAAADAASKKPAREPSSCPAGTALNGLAYLKGQADPVALPDEEYPDWLWECLDFKTGEEVEEDANAGDEFSKSAKQRRLAAKRQKALQAKLLAEGNTEALRPKVPLHQQSINLPGQEGGDVAHNLFAAGKREELRQSMRKERKAKIKESNYLKSM